MTYLPHDRALRLTATTAQRSRAANSPNWVGSIPSGVSQKS
jgi:hypothetical protein